MKRLDPETIDYYNSEIVPMIVEKYGYSQMDALRVFVASKTHKMLENEDCGLRPLVPEPCLKSGKQKR